MKSIIILLIMMGVIFITVGYIKTNQMCPPPIVQYRYYPRSFEEEQTNPCVTILKTATNDIKN